MTELPPTISPTTMVQYARIYAALGFIPIPLNGKVPILAEWQNQPAGEDKAAGRLQHHGGNIGLALPDDLIVIDVDIKADKNGVNSLQALESGYGELPSTLTQITASGGLHYVFRKQPNLILKNTVNLLGDGLDIRTRGGQIVVEPSTINGKEYVWQDWDVLSGEMPEIADAPEWLLRLLTVPTNSTSTTKSTARMITEGQRNQRLFQVASAMRSRGDCASAILEQLRYENAERCSPPLDDGELKSIANSVGRYAQANSSDEWPNPIPLINPICPEPYPLDAFPDKIRAAVMEVQAFTKAPTPLVASSALAALSLAAQAHADIKRAEKLQGPVSLFLLSIADSGERKSTCDRYFMDAIRDYEARETEAAKALIKDYQADAESWEAKRSGIKSKIIQLSKGGKSSREQDEALRDLEHCKPEPPRVPRMILGDETPENLAWSLVKLWPTAGVVSSEAGTVFGSHGMGKDSVMRNLSLLNVLWDGGVHSIGRRTSESFVVRDARLTMALQVQEATLRSFFERSGGLARGIGFMARFLISWPESTQGTRFFSDPPDTWPALARFNHRVTDILDSELKLDTEGALAPPLLSLSNDAKKAWVMFHDAIEAELSTDGELYDVRDVASKTADNAVRIATLLQLFESTTGTTVGMSAFEGASRIAMWHLLEARRFFEELALPDEHADAVRLEAWLIEYCRQKNTLVVPRREVQRNVTPGYLRQKGKLDSALSELVEHYRVRLIQEGKRKDIHVNPTLLREDD